MVGLKDSLSAKKCRSEFLLVQTNLGLDKVNLFNMKIALGSNKLVGSKNFQVWGIFVGPRVAKGTWRLWSIFFPTPEKTLIFKDWIEIDPVKLEAVKTHYARART